MPAMSTLEGFSTKSGFQTATLTPALSLVGSNFAKANTAKSPIASRNVGPFKNTLNNSPIRPMVRSINEM